MREEMSRDGFVQKHSVGDGSKRDKGKKSGWKNEREQKRRRGEREAKAGELCAC